MRSTTARLRASRATPRHASTARCCICLSGNLKDGWRDYAARLKVPGKAPVAEHKLAQWTGESLKRTRLLVTAEQGVGDQIMFASMIPELAERAATEDGSVILECEPRLDQVCSRALSRTSRCMPGT